MRILTDLWKTFFEGFKIVSLAFLIGAAIFLVICGAGWLLTVAPAFGAIMIMLVVILLVGLVARA